VQPAAPCCRTLPSEAPVPSYVNQDCINYHFTGSSYRAPADHIVLFTDELGLDRLFIVCFCFIQAWVLWPGPGSKTCRSPPLFTKLLSQGPLQRLPEHGRQGRAEPTMTCTLALLPGAGGSMGWTQYTEPSNSKYIGYIGLIAMTQHDGDCVNGKTRQ
jgi:hypothetical protein